MNDFRLSDLLELGLVQKMADAHYQAAGMPIGIIDAIDDSILIGTGWQDICVQFHRANPKSLKKCQESDRYIKEHLVPGKACHYKCKNGLWDIGIPILIGGRHLATLFLGQFFYEGEIPDRAFFIRQAREFGFDLDGYLKALDNVPVFTHEKVAYILEYNKALAGFLTDLAEHSLMKIRANQALRDSEDKYRFLVENANSIILRMDVNGNVIFLNEFAQRFFGYQEKDILGSNVLGTIVPETESTGRDLRAMIKDIGQNPDRYTANENENICRDGKRVWIAWTNKPIYDKTGAIREILCVGNDVTERKQVEDELSKIFRMSLDMICTADINTATFLKVNPAFTEILGYTEEELLEKSFMKFIHPEDIIPTLDVIEKGLKKGKKVINFKNRYRCKDGSYRWLNWVSHPVPEKGLTYAVAHDITEEKKTEKKLTAAREMFLTVLDSIDASIYVADMSTYEILFMNKHTIESFGRDMTGEKCWRVFGRESGTCQHCTNDRLLDENGKPTGVCVWQGQNPITGKWSINYDRAIQWMDGRYVRIQIATDISYIIKIEEELRQAHKMEAIGTLAGGIAHDFNNILSPIMMHAEMAMMDLAPDSPIQHNLQNIYQAGERARDLVKQILTFARRTDEHRVPLKASLIVKEATKFLRSTFPSTINIKYNLNAKQDGIFADPTQMNQIVINLCTNAAHAMRENGGTLELNLTDQYVESEEASQFFGLTPGQYLKLSVSDTGHGISNDIIDKIFDPYFSTKNPGEGTGMGLAIIQGIVKNYGGDITVESEVGKGTTFHVWLPAAEADVSAPKEPEASLPGGKERILLVDDEKASVNIMKSMLERLGYQVTPNTRSSDALEAFRKQPETFDLVVTDMTMPNMTGSEMAQKLMSIRADIPIILCTGFSEQVDEKMAAEMGIRGFFMKPIVMKDMAHIIRDVLDKN